LLGRVVLGTTILGTTIVGARVLGAVTLGVVVIWGVRVLGALRVVERELLLERLLELPLERLLDVPPKPPPERAADESPSPARLLRASRHSINLAPVFLLALACWFPGASCRAAADPVHRFVCMPCLPRA